MADTSASHSNFARSLTDVALASDSTSRIAKFSRTATDSSVETDQNNRAVSLPRSLTDNAAEIDGLSRSLALIKTAEDASSMGDATTRLVTETRAASDEGRTSDASSRLLSLPRTGVNWTLFPASELFPEAVLYPGPSVPDSSASEDSVNRLVTMSRTISETSTATEIPHGIASLFVNALDSAISTEIPHGIAGLFVNALDASVLSDITSHVTTYVRNASDVAQSVGIFAGGLVNYCMGYLIWPEAQDNQLQNHPQFTGLEELPISPINLLRVYEGRLFPRHHKGAIYPEMTLHPSSSLYPSEGEVDIFSFQLTRYPWSVNKPRQITDETQGLVPFLTPLSLV